MAPTEASRGAIGRLLAVLALLTALLASVVWMLEQNLDSFYVFDTDHLHDLARRSIEHHPDDMRAIVQYIVDELDEKTGGYVNRHEEWVFNNAGGAMGGMYIIHASEFLSPSPSPCPPISLSVSRGRVFRARG